MSEIVRKRDALRRIFLDAAAGLSCVRKGHWWEFFFILILFGVILPLVLDMGAVGVVLLWWKNRCADKRPISMDCTRLTPIVKR